MIVSVQYSLLFFLQDMLQIFPSKLLLPYMPEPITSAKHIKYEAERERRINRRRSLGTELNAMFTRYYKSLLSPLFPSEEDWDSFTSTLGVPLHLVFRVTASNNMRPELMSLLRDLHVVKPCNVLPKGLAYECSNEDFDTPRVKKIIQNLHASASITFQESVSMIPSIALTNALKKQPNEAQPRGWYLLDSCAAPASKSLHLLDLMHVHGQSRGVLLSVEFDRVKATQNLPARLKRSQSPCSIAIHGDATRLPRLFSEVQGRFIDFDGVLCDVPCSGDGTCRKDNTIQARWDASYAAKLHAKQCAILRRGVEHLRCGGICVYSTCSLNPVENECVFLRYVLNEMERTPVAVCNIGEFVPNFRFSPAVIPADPGSCFEDVMPALPGEHANFSCESACKTIKLEPEHIGRVLPHTNNTGGFFTAMMQKKLSADDIQDKVPMNDTSKSFSHWGGYKRFRELSEAEVQFIHRFYGVDTEKLTKETGMRLVVHGANEDKPKRVLLMSQGCYEILHALLYKARRETISYAGVRVFSFWSSKLFQGGNAEENIPFRTTNEGAQHIAPFSSGRRVLHLCALQHRQLVFSLLKSGICMSSKLTEAFRELDGKPSVKIAACLNILQDSLDNETHSFDHLQTNNCDLNDSSKEIEPGPLWIALHMKALRDKKSCRDNVPESGESAPSIVWLSGVLYFTRLELTTKEPIRQGISLLLHQAISVRI